MDEQVIIDRRALHRIPELDRTLPKTLAYVRAALEPLHCVITAPCKGALCAFFDANKRDTVAFRADLDALPIAEQNECAYSSLHPGRMHACGHDGHTAMVLALARIVDATRDALPHNVLLIFEPAEETTGGAREICASGILEQHRVMAVFGMHLWPNLAAGVLATRPGALMASACEVDVTVIGKSAHIAKATQGADAVEAAASFLLRAYRAVREAEPHDAVRLLKFGVLKGGTVRNALAAHAQLEGSLRAFSSPLLEQMKRSLQSIATETEQETGCALTLHYSMGYPAVCNDVALTARAAAALKNGTLQPVDAPSMTAEDFAFYGQQVPSVFFFLGTGRSDALHSDTFDFDETALIAGVACYEKLLWI